MADFSLGVFGFTAGNSSLVTGVRAAYSAAVSGLFLLSASLGVFLRDIGQIVGVLTMALMYITPIFYPVSILPVEYQSWMRLNPLTNSIQQVRNVMMWGRGLDWSSWVLEMMLGLVIAWLGFTVQKTRKGFADVV